MFQSLCGAEALQNVLIVTNMWGLVPYEQGVEREQELRSSELFFKPALDQDAIMLRHDNTRDSAQAIVRRLMPKMRIPLLLQKELVDDKKKFSATAAGRAVQDQILQALEDLSKQLHETQHEMAQREREIRADYEEKIRTLRRELDRINRNYKEARKAENRLWGFWGNMRQVFSRRFSPRDIPV